VIALLMLFLWMVFWLISTGALMSGDPPIRIDYTTLKDMIASDNVESIHIQGNEMRGSFLASIKYPPDSPISDQGLAQEVSDRFVSTLPPFSDPSFAALLDDHGVMVFVESNRLPQWIESIITYGPLSLFLSVFLWLSRRKTSQL